VRVGHDQWYQHTGVEIDAQESDSSRIARTSVTASMVVDWRVGR
jgi:hypothetical protein